MGRSTAALRRRDSGQSGVAAISVVVNFVAIELPFQIALVPKQRLIEVFAPDSPDQSLDESMRTGCAGNGFDLINLKDPKVCPLAGPVRWIGDDERKSSSASRLSSNRTA